MGIAILTFNPKIIAIVLAIFCIKHIVLMFSFGLLYISHLLFSIVLIGL